MQGSPSGDDRYAAADDVVAVLTATRELLWAETPADVQASATRLVEALGGQVVRADDADSDALPVDVSFGQGVPLLPSAPAVSVAHMNLARHLPAFVRAAHRALELVGRTHRLVEEAEIDPLTGLPTRRRVGRALGRLETGDVVIMLDLDDFKRLNDTLGHDQGDRVLRTFGRVINDTVRARDHPGRFGGEEFVVILPADHDAEGAETFLVRLRASWEASRPHPVTFSAGIAAVGVDPSTALPAADAAMYAAKRAGRDQWLWADRLHESAATQSPPTSTTGPTAGFVASSHLTVPEAGRHALIEAFERRLGLVDEWPGFRRLEVWASQADPSAFVMVSWWDDETAFRSYMASDVHRLSHDRIIEGERRPRPDTFLRYEIVAR